MSSIYSSLLAVLDQQFIFKHRISSSVKRLAVTFDHKTKENVVTLEYRVSVDHGDSLVENDYDSVGPQMEAVREERRYRARRKIVDPWNKELELMLDQYPFLDNYVM